MTVQELNSEFGISGKLSFYTGNGGWPYVEINHDLSKANISIYGAHILNFIPKDSTDLLWNTSHAFFSDGKAIRGGIPICWPWFGPHNSNKSKPAHGFGRLSHWNVVSTSIKQSGDIQLSLQLNSSSTTEILWPHKFSATLSFIIGKELQLNLDIINTGNEVFTFTNALHSYFNVGDISKIKIEGLSGVSYYDSTDNGILKNQEESMLVIQKEVNRRYLTNTSKCIIHDASLNRKIKVESKGNQTTVLWNPWIETAKSFADMDDDGYKTMVCIEAANAFDEYVTLQSGQTHTLSTNISLLEN